MVTEESNNLLTMFLRLLSAAITTTPDTATSPEDFTAIAQNIVIPGNQGSYPVQLTIVDDEFMEPNEIFTLSISAANVGITNAATTITIVDDGDTVAPPGGGGGGGKI